MKSKIQEHTKNNIKNRSKTFFYALLLCLSAVACKDREDPTANPVDQLPPATTTGANTIGCLVNGEVFLPRQNNPTGPSPTNCYYQFIDGEWEFGLGFTNDKDGVKGITILSNKYNFIEGQTYSIKSELSQNSIFAFYTLPNNQGYRTTDSYMGQLKITKLDKINHIICGTFYFDAIRVNTGEIIQIREGRFDMHYTP